MNRRKRSIIKFIIFLSIANLPFITVCNLVGLETFIDSFENPESYIFIQEKQNSMNYDLKDGSYMVIQKYLETDYDIKEGDTVIYLRDDGEIDCKKIQQINCIGPIKRFHTVSNECIDEAIYENQIIGKVVEIVDNNLWNMISMKLWDISIHDYNINALFANE